MKDRKRDELLMKLRELLSNAEIGEREAALILNFVMEAAKGL